MAVLSDHSFATVYMELCRQQRLRPLPTICVTLPHALDFTVDRIKLDDWAPILNSLSLDRTLRTISVRVKNQHRKHLDHANSESKARAVGKAPVVLSRYILECLSHSLAQCTRNSSSLTSLELEGIPWPPDCLAVLCHGLAGTKSLQHVSLQRCHIGDTGCEIVCRAIAEVQSIRSLNLGHCDLTGVSGPALASALSRQKLSLYHDAWKQSLRYREPKLENMPGLRRLTLNGNAKLGNEAVIGIIDAIRDSLWFKALDLQQCGLTDDISREIIQLLEQNQTLVVVDVRLNSDVRADSLADIARRLERNELSCKKSEYRWLNLPHQKESTSGSVKQRTVSAGNIRKQKSSDEVGPGAKSGHPRPRSAIIRHAKRPPAPVVYRKPLLMPLPQVFKRMRTKSTLPVIPVLDSKRISRQPMKPPPRSIAPLLPQQTPKMSLHLDLQSQLNTLADPTQNNNASSSLPAIDVSAAPDDRAQHTSTGDEPSAEAQRLQQVVHELLECQEERDKLLEDKRRLELSLTEERARREFAESKLRAARSNLSELEEAQRRRERDSRSYLSISQKSMEELCLSFGRLLEMLEESSLRRSADNSVDSEEESQLREDIKRRFALIIRKTKSENLKKGNYFVDEDRLLPRLQLTARYGRSEGNIRTTVEPLAQPVRMERHIGDTAETSSALPQLVTPSYSTGRDARLPSSAGRRLSAGDEPSPSDRARALFASIVSGNALLGINTRLR
ncbi:centrosomal protein of 78 kDa [Copidosoma floridanum]|uniref:centrosomal protein of 78 kDa n=1 Tax=Copidosoma floridanum TaxID=29053 RepID=UPI0006C9A66C|nr:centrosomal protein of 78 kDa [Copidosoma floridanum]